MIATTNLILICSRPQWFFQITKISISVTEFSVSTFRNIWPWLFCEFVLTLIVWIFIILKIIASTLVYITTQLLLIQYVLWSIIVFTSRWKLWLRCRWRITEVTVYTAGSSTVLLISLIAEDKVTHVKYIN